MLLELSFHGPEWTLFSLVNGDSSYFREPWPSRGADESGVILAETNEDFFFEEISESHLGRLPATCITRTLWVRRFCHEAQGPPLLDADFKLLLAFASR